MAKIQKSWFDVQAEKFEATRLGSMSWMITAQSCWASIAAALALQDNNYESLAVVAVLGMASNAAFIAQGPAKWCIGIFYSSVVVNLLIIVWHLIQ